MALDMVITSYEEFITRLEDERNNSLFEMKNITYPKLVINLMKINYTKVLPRDYLREVFDFLYNRLIQDKLTQFTVNQLQLPPASAIGFLNSLEIPMHTELFRPETRHESSYISLSKGLFIENELLFEGSILDNTILSILHELPIEKSRWYFKSIGYLEKISLGANFIAGTKALIFNYMYITGRYTVPVRYIRDLWVYLICTHNSTWNILYDIGLDYTRLSVSEIKSEEELSKGIEERLNNMFKLPSNLLRLRDNNILLSNNILFESISDCSDTTRYDITLSGLVDVNSFFGLSEVLVRDIIDYINMTIKGNDSSPDESDKVDEETSKSSVCKICGLDMKSSEGCTVSKISYDGASYPRIKVGDRNDTLSVIEGSDRCHDCGALKGHYHHWKCNSERCPVCGGQLVDCGCTITVEENDEETVHEEV